MPVASFAPAGNPASLALLSGGRIAYSIGPDAVTNRVEVFDPATGRTRVVARTSYKGGLIDWVIGASDFVVWVDESRFPNDANPAVRWTMFSLRLAAGKPQVLATSGAEATDQVPLPAANDGFVAWSLPSMARPGTADLTLLDMNTGRRMVRNVPAVSDVVGTAAGFVIGFVPGDGGLDVVAWPMPTGKARPLTHDGHGDTFIAAGGSRVSWVENDANGPTQDPTRIQVDDLALDYGPFPAVPGPNFGNPTVGSGFLAFVAADNRLTVTGFDGRFAPRAVSGAGLNVGPRWDALGDELVYSEYGDPNTATNLRVVLVRVKPIPRP